MPQQRVALASVSAGGELRSGVYVDAVVMDLEGRYRVDFPSAGFTFKAIAVATINEKEFGAVATVYDVSHNSLVVLTSKDAGTERSFAFFLTIWEGTEAP